MWKKLFRTRSERSPYITVVSGLPRSGTSMMMQMLEAGGLEVVIDHIRPADEDNPHGYYEFEEVKNVQEDTSFLDDAGGKALKVISMLLYDLPKNKQYKVIFMRRHIEEILASQKVMLQRRGKYTKKDDNENMGRLFEQHLGEITSWLQKQNNMDVIYVNYNDVIEHPRRNAQTVKQFLGHRLDVQKMVQAVDQTLYRERTS